MNSHKKNIQKEVHQKIRKNHPHATRKAKKLFSFKYPKLFLLIFSILVAYYFFSKPGLINAISSLDKFSYFGIFLAGIFLAFGFSAPFGVGFLLMSNPSNILLATLIGGIGNTLGDAFIFKMIKFSFSNEFEKLKKSGLAKEIKKVVSRNILMKHYLLYIFAGIMIASPLPDEIGISMLAGLTTIKFSKFLIISFILHTIATFIILYLGVIF